MEAKFKNIRLNYRQPALAGLPSVAIGALFLLHIFGMELTIIATIGILLLIGIINKNAILMIDFALEAKRGQVLTPKEAICTAFPTRFHPILMTTLAAMMGALPIALGLSAELRMHCYGRCPCVI